MMKSVLAAAAAFGFVLVAAAPVPAQADGWGRYHHPYRHWHDGPRYHSGVTFYFGTPRVYHRPPPVVVYRYAPPPPPVVIYREPTPRIAYVAPPVSAVPASPVYTDSLGRACREYQTTLRVGGTVQPGYGTACLQADGSWRIVR